MPKTVDIDRIHKTTLEVFVEFGYEAATTKEIAARAGVNEVTLYRRFNTKAELIRTALAQELGKSPFAHIQASADPQADLSLIVKAYIETFETFGAAVMTLLFDAARNPELQSATSALLPNLQNATQIIAKHQATGHIASGNPMAKLLSLIAPLAMIGMTPAPMRDLLGPLTQMNPDKVAREFLHGHRRART